MWTISRTTFRKICKKRTSYPHYFFIVLLFLGCASLPKPIKKKDSPPRIKQSHKIHLGALDFIQRDDHRQILWFLSSESSKVTYREDGTLYGQLRDAQGKFYYHQKPVTSFKASIVEVDQQKKMLVMKKSIEIYSLEHKIKIYAENALYLPKEKKILVEGKVKIESENFISGPFNKVRASLDLKDIGTSNSF